MWFSFFLISSSAPASDIYYLHIPVVVSDGGGSGGAQRIMGIPLCIHFAINYRGIHTQSLRGRGDDEEKFASTNTKQTRNNETVNEFANKFQIFFD